MTFAEGLPAAARAYDRKTDTDEMRRAKLGEYERLGVEGNGTNQAAVTDAGVILSLVTADQALTAARETARSIAAGALFLDMNSVAPATKAVAAEAITRAGGRYVDAAIMAPVRPKALGVPVLLSGPAASDAAAALKLFGFSDIRVVGDRIGLHPVAVIFAVLAGGQLFGFLGMLVALPVAAVANVLLRHAHERYLHSTLYAGETPGFVLAGEGDGLAPEVVGDVTGWNTSGIPLVGRGTRVRVSTTPPRSGMPSGGNEKCLPWKENRSSRQAARITSIDSSKISRLSASASRLIWLSPLATTAPSDCASRGTVPLPTPNCMRPPLRTSAMA